MGDVKQFPAPITPETLVYVEDWGGPSAEEGAVIKAARDWQRARSFYYPGKDRWELDHAEEELERAVRRLGG